MIELLQDRDADRAYVYVNLARKRIHDIEEAGSEPGDVISLVNDNLKRADDLATKGQSVDAEKIWNGIVTLYGANHELESNDGGPQRRIDGLQPVFRNGVADEIGYGVDRGAGAAWNTRQKAVLCDQHEAEQCRIFVIKRAEMRDHCRHRGVELGFAGADPIELLAGAQVGRRE